jgi:hypothetical protein
MNKYVTVIILDSNRKILIAGCYKIEWKIYIVVIGCCLCALDPKHIRGTQKIWFSHKNLLASEHFPVFSTLFIHKNSYIKQFIAYER